MEILEENSFKKKLLEYWEKVKTKYNEKRAFDKTYSYLRISSIDFFRGIMVIFTIFLICQGLESHIEGKYMISVWNGMTFADIVLPFFLMIMGMSVPFYIKKYHFLLYLPYSI